MKPNAHPSGADGSNVMIRWRINLLFFIASLTLASAAPSELNGSDWRCFRGAFRNGVAKYSRHPVSWAEDSNVAWKQNVEGVGWSQPIVCKGRVYITTAVCEDQLKPKTGEAGPGFNVFSAEGISRSFLGGGTPADVTYQWKLICFDSTTGQRLWEKVVREAKPSVPIHRSNSYASETPICDGRQIYVYIAMAGLYCLDLEGNVVWEKPLASHNMQFGWGTGGSAMLFCNTLYVQCDNEQASYVVAINRITGEEIWRVEREEMSNWSTPYLWDSSDGRELITCGGTRFRSYDLRTGELLWEMPAEGRSVASAVSDRQYLYVSSVTRSTGRSGNLTAIKSGARGQLSPNDTGAESHIAWNVRKAAPEIASPLLYKNRLYTVSQFGGVVNCYDARTGERLFRERLPGAGGFTASPWAAGENIFCLDENGKAFAFAARESELKISGTSQLNGMFWSSAAVTDDAVLLRSSDHLYCVRNAAQQPSPERTISQ